MGTALLIAVVVALVLFDKVCTRMGYQPAPLGLISPYNCG